MVLVLVAGFSGCLSSSQAPLQLQVPVIYQEPQHCGAASLGMVLRFYGQEADQNALEKALFIPMLGGTTPELIVDLAQKRGFEALRCTGSIADIKGELEQGRPVIALWGPKIEGEPGHFVVVTGMDKARKAYRIHDGTRENRRVRAKTFHRRWEGSQRTMIRVLPSAENR